MFPFHLPRISYLPIPPQRIFSLNNLKEVIAKIKPLALLYFSILAIYFMYLLFSEATNRKTTPIPISKEISFQDINPEEKSTISYIIQNLATKDLWWLFKHRKEMQKKGEQVKHVHPLKFLTIILQNPCLKNTCIPAILKDKIKKKSFMDGFNKSMNRQFSNLQMHLNDFMQTLNIKSSHGQNLTGLLNQKDWEGFVQYLLNIC